MQAAFSQALVEGLGRVPGKSEGLGNGGAPGVKFITNPPACKNWLLAATQGIAKANAIIQGSTLNFGNLFLNIMHVAGPGLQYFTYEGHLYKFWYTGYDTKTGKYNQGSQYKNTIYVCTDGMSVLKNPDGTSEYLVVPSGSGGEVLVTNTPPKREFDKFYRSPAMLVHDAKEEPLMESAFNIRGRGLGRTPRNGDHAFNPALLRGLGRAPRGLGDGNTFAGGSSSDTTTLTVQSANYANINPSDWVTFYDETKAGEAEADTKYFRTNTNLAMSSNDQPSYMPIGAFHDAYPIGTAIVNQVKAAAIEQTLYWTLWDHNNRAAYTIGPGPFVGDYSGNGTMGTTAFIRSSWPQKGKLRLEIATRTAVPSIDSISGWPSKALVLSSTDAATLATGYTWLQAYGPVTGADVAKVVMSIALAGGDENNAISVYYNSFLSHLHFLQGIPSLQWGPWFDWTSNHIKGPVPIPSSSGTGASGAVPMIYFTYHNQLYRMYWWGPWQPFDQSSYSEGGLDSTFSNVSVVPGTGSKGDPIYPTASGYLPSRTSTQGVVIDVCKNPPAALLSKYGGTPLSNTTATGKVLSPIYKTLFPVTTTAPAKMPIKSPLQGGGGGGGAEAPASTTSGLVSGYTWVSQGNTAVPPVGTVITATISDANGIAAPVTGVVTAADSVNVTFTPITPMSITIGGQSFHPPPDPAFSSPTAPIQVPLAYVASCFNTGLAAGFCWVATGNTAPPNVGDTVMAWCVSGTAQQAFAGVVSDVDSSGNVTFTRTGTAARAALATSNTTAITIPTGYVLDVGVLQNIPGQPPMQQAPIQQAPIQQAPAPAPTSVSTGAIVLGAIVGIAVLGGIAYYVME